MPPEHRSLWSDGPSEDDHHGWLDPEPERPAEEPTREHRADDQPTRQHPRERPPRDPDAPSAWTRFRRRLLTPLVALCAVALLVSGIAIGTQLVGTRDVERTVVQSSGGGASSSAIKAAYEATHDGVVRVSTNSGNGTGWVYDDRGTIVTNNHVVSGGGDSIKVRFGDRGEDVSARLLGTDVSSDLAVLRVDPNDVQKLVPLKVADSDDVQTGDPVIAIGYPLGLDQTTTAGIISGVGRQIQAQNNFSIDRVLQTDAPINPGNSGGPLLDTKGRVVGVNSQIATTGAGGGSVGIGFAIPSNTVKAVVPTLERGGKVQHAYLGVQLAQLTGTKGAAVAVITPGGPAARSDLKALSSSASLGGTPDGDVIVGIDGEDVERPDDVTRIVNDHKPGDTLKLEVQRGGDKRTVQVTLADRPANAGGSSSGSATPSPTPTTPTNPLSPSIP